MKILAIVIFFLVVPVAVAEERDWSGFDLVETWLCFDRYEGSKRRPLIVLTRYRLEDVEDVQAGDVKVAGAVHLATFSVSGLNRRWNFGESYAFIIRPDGSGLYYDFTNVADGESTGADQSFKCVLK